MHCILVIMFNSLCTYITFLFINDIQMYVLILTCHNNITLVSHLKAAIQVNWEISIL